MKDRHTFDEIHEEYHDKIVHYLIRIVGANDAEDVAQEVFNKANEHIGNLKEDSKLSTWLYRIATNTAIDKLRSAAYQHSLKHIPIEVKSDIESRNIWTMQASNTTEQNLIRKEMSECVQEFVDKLPPDYRIIIALSELEGLTNKEISQILDISLENAKIRLHRARKKLKKLLDQGCDFYINEQNTLVCDRKQSQILPKPPK
ncbi:RNA polymerase sigma factor [Desulfospira joergensenii]|uniref:RNA polymerase sigma factor n=1 Tax=Desulfospira joergensenii TaxID=53329 RepID=UPI0003B43B8D|nr:sigma-70 family RNA polymerase sigma factor [Desulfospira joergensenii]